MMKNLRHILSASWVIAIPLTLAGCSHPVLDYRNAEVSDGLLYAGGANEPFTGTVTHVPDSFMINGEGQAKFMNEIGGDKYAVTKFVQAILGRGSPTVLCTISVRKGYVDGAATCFLPQSDTKTIEAHFVGGQLSGKLIYYNPDQPDQKLAEGNFDGGQPDGQQKIYSASKGELVEKVNWSQGLYDGSYASYNETNGKVVLTGAFVKGSRDGTWKQYTKDGKQLIVRAKYKNGRLDGVEEHFDGETGERTMLVDRWIDGKISGNRKIWDKNGLLVSDETYADGTLVAHKDVSATSDSGTVPLEKQLVTALSGSVSVASPPKQEAAESSPANHQHEAPANLDTCVNDWTAAHRKAVGEDAVITADQLDEWREWCGQGKHAPM